ncbi:MAG: hypothetical protein IPP40_11825 [bacterium]|nr:hypothetical protein [bacterium]
MLYALLFLSILFTSAQATIPLRLVTEIQLPARTVTWDVQHVEDSTSFGWAALTEGETVWGVDSTYEEYLIAVAVDTIWYQTRSNENVQQYLFSREEYNAWDLNFRWSGLALLSLPGHTGLCAVAHAYTELDRRHDLYYFDLQGDTVAMRQTLFSEGWDATHYYFNGIDVWPALPNTAEWLVVAGIRSNQEEYHYNCHVTRYRAIGTAFPVLAEVGTQLWYSSFQFYRRSPLLAMAYISEYRVRSTPICELPDVNSYAIGYGERDGNFESTNVDTFELPGRVVAQEDFDGTKRIFYSNGNCYNAATGAIEFTNLAIADTTLSAYVRNAPGEDFLVLQNSRFLVYDGRTGVLVDSTTEIQGVPQKKFVSSGFDELLTYDAAQKLVRIYQPFETLLSIQATENGNVRLSWTTSPGATSYRLDRSDDAEFNNFFPDYFAPTITSIEFQPTTTIEFFRVTPIFE